MLKNIKIRRNFGLKNSAILIFLLLVILPTLGVGILVHSSYTNILQKQYIESTQRNLDSVVNQLEEQLSMVEDIADYLIYNADLNEYLKNNDDEYSEENQALKSSVEGLLIFHLFSKSYIRSISINGLNGHSIEMGEPITADEERWIKHSVEQRGKVVWSESYPVKSGWDRDGDVVSLFRVLNLYKDVTTPLGNLVIRLDQTAILNLLLGEQFKDQGALYVIGPNGESILHTKNNLTNELNANDIFNEMNRLKIRDIEVKVDEKKYYAFLINMDVAGWSVIAAIPEAIVKEQLVEVTVIMNVLLAGMLILLVTALIGFQSMIINPILRLKIETTKVMMGDFNARVPTHSNNEITDLSRKFNQMVDTIKELIDHKYKIELRERETELKLLHSQMDPHFLYNTLDTIRWTARLENAEKASHLIEMLSRFFRSSMNNGQFETTILQEMQFVQSYLVLHQVRLGSRLSYALHLDYTVEEVLIPKTIIQPLVENYLIHGFNTKSKKNWIKVNVYRCEDEVWIDVIDNGKGIPLDLKQKIENELKNLQRKHKKIGALQNINERLNIYYRSNYSFEFIENNQVGTWVRIKMPYVNSNGVNNNELSDIK